jgi:hypothetical protein
MKERGKTRKLRERVEKGCNAITIDTRDEIKMIDERVERERVERGDGTIIAVAKKRRERKKFEMAPSPTSARNERDWKEKEDR